MKNGLLHTWQKSMELLGCLATNGGKDVKDLRDLHTDDLEYEIALSMMV